MVLYDFFLDYYLLPNEDDSHHTCKRKKKSLQKLCFSYSKSSKIQFMRKLFFIEKKSKFFHFLIKKKLPKKTFIYCCMSFSLSVFLTLLSLRGRHNLLYENHMVNIQYNNRQLRIFSL